MRAPWTATRLTQSVLKEFNLEYSLEGLMLKLKLQYFSHWKNLMLGKIKGKRRRKQQSMRRLGSITDSMNLSKLREIVKDRAA